MRCGSDNLTLSPSLVNLKALSTRTEIDSGSNFRAADVKCEIKKNDTKNKILDQGKFIYLKNTQSEMWLLSDEVNHIYWLTPMKLLYGPEYWFQPLCNLVK